MERNNPTKYVLTSETLDAAPSYIISIWFWNTLQAMKGQCRRSYSKSSSCLYRLQQQMQYTAWIHQSYLTKSITTTLYKVFSDFYWCIDWLFKQ